MKNRGDIDVLADRETSRRILEAMAEGVAIIDGAGVIVFANRAARDLVGGGAELVGRNFRELIAAEDVPKVEAGTRRRKQGRRDRYDARVGTSDGRQRVLSISASPYCDAAGKVIGSIGVFLDATESRLAEDRLRRYAERLKVLHEIDEAILGARGLEDIARTALEGIERLVPCRRAAVMELDAGTRCRTILATSLAGRPRLTAGGQLDADEVGLPEELLAGRPHVVEDIDRLASPTPLERIVRREGVRSYVVLPLVCQGATVGTLSVGADRPAAYTIEDVEIMRELADLLAIAIARRRAE